MKLVVLICYNKTEDCWHTNTYRQGMQIYCSISRILSTYDGKLGQLFKTTLKTYLMKKREVYRCIYRSSWYKLFWYSVALFLSKLSLSHFTSLEVCDKVVKVLTEQKSYNKDNFTLSRNLSTYFSASSITN